MSTEAPLKSALEKYLSHGLTVFPLKPHSKKPLIPWKEFTEEKPRHDRTNLWLKQYSNANIGLITGAPNNLVVFDEDGPEAKALIDSNGGFPTCPTSKTAKGYHYFFKHPGFEVRNNVNGQHKLDVRGDGGYVVAPPSNHPNGQHYEWLPGLSLFDLAPPELAPWQVEYLKKHCSNDARATDVPNWPDTALKGVAEGERNNTAARLARHYAAKGLSLEEVTSILVGWNRKNSPPLDEKEIAKTAFSIWKGHQNQLRDQRKVSVKFEDLTGWHTTDPPQEKWLYIDCIHKGIVAGINAMGGTGKTFFILALIAAGVLGQSALGMFTPERPIKIIALLAEDPASILQKRLYQIGRVFLSDKLSKEDIEAAFIDNLRLTTEAAPLMEYDSNRNPQPTDFFFALVDEAERFEPDLIIVDPKAQFYGLDELNNDHNTIWVKNLQSLTRKGAGVLFTHHIPKGANPFNPHALRGGSALADASRWCMGMETMSVDDAKCYRISDPHNYVKCRITKNSYAPLDGDSHYFRRGEGGILEPVFLDSDFSQRIAEAIAAALSDHLANGGATVTRNELLSRSKGKELREAVNGRVGKVTAKDLSRGIDHGLKGGLLKERDAGKARGQARKEIEPAVDCANASTQDCAKNNPRAV